MLESHGLTDNEDVEIIKKKKKERYGVWREEGGKGRRSSFIMWRKWKTRDKGDAGKSRLGIRAFHGNRFHLILIMNPNTLRYSERGKPFSVGNSFLSPFMNYLPCLT